MSDLTLTIPTDTSVLRPEPKADHPVRELLRPLPTAGHYLLVVDNSSLEVFTTCPKAADYKVVRRREAHARNAALTFGGAVHAGLERFLHAQFVWQGTADFGPLYSPTCYSTAEQDQSIVNYFTDNPAPPDEYRTVQNALAVMSAYRERAALPDYSWSLQSDSLGPLIERAFELPLGVLLVNATILIDGKPTFVHKIHVAWSGRIDAVAECGNPKVVRVVDHKTGSVIDPMEYQIANQTLGYVWAGRQLWPELDVKGFCLNAIHFRRPAASYKGALTDKGPRGGDGPLNFFRAYFDYSELRLQQWQADMINIVSDFVHCLVRNHFSRHTKWCNGKFGRCQYFDVCSQDDPKVRASLLQSDMYKPVTWNPVNAR